MEETIFSRSMDVMCFSLPRLTHCIESPSLCVHGEMVTGRAGDCERSRLLSELSETAESTLAERSGTSKLAGRGLAMSIAGVTAN